MSENNQINYRLRKNLPFGTLYNSQVAALIFVLSLSFKLSAAPGIISANYRSSTLWLYILYTIVEISITLAILLFAKKMGDNFLTATNSLAYRLVCALCSILMTIKATVYFCFCASYLSHELFSGVEPYLLYIAFLAPIVYLGIKGIRTIARSAEIFAIIFFGVIMINLIFLDTDMDFGRNLPIFAIEPSEFFKNAPKFSIYLGDCIPFMFVRIRNKRIPYISMGIALSSLLVNVIVLLGVAMYGDALKMATDLLIHIAAFNQLSLEIGRMEWTNLFAMLMMAILSISFLYRGAINAFLRATNYSLPAKILFPASLAVFSIFIPSARTVTSFATEEFGYFIFALVITIPILLLTILFSKKKKLSGIYNSLDIEYKTKVPLKKQKLSFADGILDDFENSAIKKEEMSANGQLVNKEGR